MYGLVRSLKGGNTAQSLRNVVLEHKEKTVASGLQKANLYVCHYASVSCHRFTKEGGKNQDVKEAFTAHWRAKGAMLKKEGRRTKSSPNLSLRRFEANEEYRG